MRAITRRFAIHDRNLCRCAAYLTNRRRHQSGTRSCRESDMRPFVFDTSRFAGAAVLCGRRASGRDEDAQFLAGGHDAH